MPRALRRHHRARVIRNRVNEARQVSFATWRLPRTAPSPWPDGHFARHQAALGCGHPRCGVCHPDKLWHSTADRMRAEREWQRDWDAHRFDEAGA
jgi:hypothetical protein